MRKFLGKLGEAIPGPLLYAATLLLLISPAVCHALDPCSNHPTPAIISITPDVWFAGQTYNKVTFTGTNLSSSVGIGGANCPVVISVEMDTGSVSLGVNSQSSTQIAATVTPDPSDPTETACVTAAIFYPLVVRAAKSANATPAAGAAGSPCTDPDGNQGITVQILDNQIQCDPSMNCTQPVISTTDGTPPPVQDADVGQPIILTTPALPNGIKATKTIWTVGGTKIAGYNPTTGPTKVTPLKADDLKKANITFYWVYPNSSSPVSIPVTYQYCVDIPGADADGKCSLVANAVFNLSGPGDAQMTTDAYGYLNIDWLFDKNACFPILDDADPYMEYGNISGYESPCTGAVTGNPYGITFTLPAVSSNGAYTLAQLITKDTIRYTQGKAGTLACPTIPGVDGQYPYPLSDQENNQTWDYPGVKLEQIDSEVSRTFNATMYLLWTSSKTGSIPVPIGSQKWTIAQGSTTNSGYPTSQSWTQPAWNLVGADGDPVDYVTTAPNQSPYGYPTWTGPAAYVTKKNCPKDSTQEAETQEEEVQ